MIVLKVAFYQHAIISMNNPVPLSYLIIVYVGLHIELTASTSTQEPSQI